MEVINGDSGFRPIDDDLKVTITFTGLEMHLISRALPLLRDNLISGCLHSLNLQEDLKNAYYTELLYQDFEDFLDVQF